MTMSPSTVPPKLQIKRPREGINTWLVLVLCAEAAAFLISLLESLLSDGLSQGEAFANTAMRIIQI